MKETKIVSAKQLVKELDKLKEFEESQGIFRNEIDMDDILGVIDELDDYNINTEVNNY